MKHSRYMTLSLPEFVAEALTKAYPLTAAQERRVKSSEIQDEKNEKRVDNRLEKL